MDVFKSLAKKLDELPEGFPSTASGVELKILRKIFSPEEAEMTMKLAAFPETAEAIAERLHKPIEEMRTILDDMAKKGQIASFKMAGQQMYRLIPFVVGIYEFQRGERLTKELAELFEEYLPILAKEMGGHKPHLTRVIPIDVEIPTTPQVVQSKGIRQIIQQAKSFRVQDCICRKEQALLGNRCKHTLKNCLQYSMEEGAYDYFKLDGDIITKEEALKIVDEAEKEGLVHSTFNVENAIGGFLCNCCSCSCGLLRAVKKFNAPYVMAKSNYVAHIDQDTCVACGICKDERCPMDAITEDDGSFRVLDKRCIGCGVCVITCPSESIKMVERPESNRDEIAKDMIELGKQRLVSRGRHIQ